MFGINSSEKQMFLEQTREAREERHAEQRKEVSAIKIQAWIRGWLVRLHIKNNIRTSLEEILKKNTEQPKELPPALDVYNVAYKFILNFDIRKDSKYFEMYTRYLLSSMDSNVLQCSYVMCAMNKDITVQWIQHIKEVLQIACDLLETLQSHLTAENRLVSLYLHLLLTFTATNTWRLLQQHHLQPLKPTLNNLTSNIMNSVVTRGLYRTLQVVLVHGLCRGKPCLRGPALMTIVTLSLRPYIGSESSNHILSLITIHFLSIPALIHHLVTIASDSLRLLNGNKIFETVLEFLSIEQNIRIVFNSLEGRYALNILGNLMHLAYIERETALANDSLYSFVHVVDRLFDKCGEYVSVKENQKTQWHPLLGWFSQSIDTHTTDSLPYVRTQLQLLWSCPMLKIMFQPAANVVQKYLDDIAAAESKAANSEGFGKNLFKRSFPIGFLSRAASDNSNAKKFYVNVAGPTVSKICQIGSIYHTATVILSQLKMDILTGICYRSDILQTLWALIQMLGPQCNVYAFLSHLLDDKKDDAPEFHLLILVFECTTQLLSVLDDVEMYEKEVPFTLADYKVMSTFVNLFVYQIIKCSLIDSKKLNSSKLYRSAHTLLRVLLRRNSRRNFIPEEDWYISDYNAGVLVSEYKKGKLVAKIITQKIPHVLSREDRIALFRHMMTTEKNSLGRQDVTAANTLISVRRNAIVEDGFAQLADLSPTVMKGVVRVRFINKQGLDEAGIDQDGVFKEFLEEVLKKLLNPQLNLFRLTSDERLYPSPCSSLTENHLELFEFCGKMLAKAIYEGVIVDCPFASFFLSQVIGEQQNALYSFIDELPSLDAELYKNLTYVKHYEGDVNELGLTFSYDEDYLGEVVSHELRPGGKSIPVTNENKIAYVHLMAHFKLYAQIKHQTRAFVSGFRSIIDSDWLALFSVPEFQRLISGDSASIDLEDLRRHTHYFGGFHDKHKVVSWLWDVLKNDFDHDERSLFLKFVTSCSKPPLLGFSHLQPRFSIRCVEVNDDEDTGDTIGSVIRGFFAIHKKDPVNRLPSSSTCFNLLKLPNYKKKSTLRDKLRYAIHSNTGFELS